MMVCLVYMSIILPATTIFLFAMEGLLFDTVHVYIPSLLPVTVRVWVYCAVTGLSNTVSVPSVTVVEPSDSDSRSSSEDTGEGELRTVH